MKSKKNHFTPRSVVLSELLHGGRVTPEFVLKKCGYWRLAAIIYDLEKKYKIKISRTDVSAKNADFQTAYWMDDESRKKILDEKKGQAHEK